MDIKHDTQSLRFTVDDQKRATWLDGSKLYYDLPKDNRPDINPYDLEDSLQAYYKLYTLAKDGYGLNQVPPELVEALDNLKQLADTFNAYAYHVLGLVCKDRLDA